MHMLCLLWLEQRKHSFLELDLLAPLFGFATPMVDVSTAISLKTHCPYSLRSTSHVKQQTTHPT